MSIEIRATRKDPLNVLAQLCDLYNSDKGTATGNATFSGGWPYHNYTDIYEMILRPIRHRLKTLLEVGIGTNNPDLPSSMGQHGSPGASLRVWRDYFPVANIIGLDIDDDIIFSEGRIQTFLCDQTNEASIKKFFELCPFGEFDVIIDDGLHEQNAARIFFENSYHKLANEGHYFIEDAYWWDGKEIPWLSRTNLQYFIFGESSHQRMIMISK